MFRALARVIAGFLIACLAAGLVKVLFVMTPVELASVPSSAFPEKASDMGLLALLTATHTAIFAATFALVTTGIAEWLSIRSALYYLTSGAAIALLGFFAQYSSEVGGQPTILNTYAMTAYVAAGLIAGLIYWVLAGRYAGYTRHAEAGVTETAETTAAKRPRIIVEKSPAETPVKRTGWAAKRLAQSNEASAADSPAIEKDAGTPSVPVTKPIAKPAGAAEKPATEPATEKPAAD